MSTETRWFVSVAGGEPVGPVSADRVRRGVAAGKIPADAIVCEEGGSTWQPIASVLGSSPAQAQPSPRPSAQPHTTATRRPLLWLAAAGGGVLVLAIGVIVVLVLVRRDTVGEAQAEAYIKDTLAIDGAAECSWDAHVDSDGSGSGKRYWLDFRLHSEKRYQACALAMADVALMAVDCRDGRACMELMFQPANGARESTYDIKFPCGKLEFQALKSVTVGGNELKIEYTARQVPDKAKLAKLPDCTLNYTPEGPATFTTTVTRTVNETWAHALCRSQVELEFEVEQRKIENAVALNTFAPKCAYLGCSYRCGRLTKADSEAPACGQSAMARAIAECSVTRKISPSSDEFAKCLKAPEQLDAFRTRLKKRYDLARPEDVAAECGKTSDKCGDYETLETAFQNAHALGVEAMRNARTSEASGTKARKMAECDAK